MNVKEQVRKIAKAFGAAVDALPELERLGYVNAPTEEVVTITPKGVDALADYAALLEKVETLKAIEVVVNVTSNVQRATLGDLLNWRDDT